MELRAHPARRGGPVYFVGDAHIGTAGPTEEAEKEERLLKLLDEIDAQGAALVVMGDLFDFWFEYGHAIPSRGFNVLARLKRLVDSGLPIDFLGGNHDWWAGPFLQSRIGIHAHSEPIEVECQGRKLFLAHGDGLAPGDNGYRVLRKVFRNPLAIAAYRWIHPDLGIPLATRSSHTSRRHTETQPVIGARLWETIARPQFDRGRDAVLIGHFHRPIHVRSGNRDFIINGDWMGHWSYSVLEAGELTLRIWPEGKVVIPEQIT
ncbi:MAG TPA: UDP-2,3-diacylglucosamine diphosphatase [Candidatus Eisenbacteria bacterium]